MLAQSNVQPALLQGLASIAVICINVFDTLLNSEAGKTIVLYTGHALVSMLKKLGFLVVSQALVVARRGQNTYSPGA